MSMLVRLVPGLVAATAALVGMEVVSLFGFVANPFRVLVFFVTYIVVAVFAERAMAAYGNSRS